MKKELSWILPGTAVIFMVFIMALLLNVNVLAIFAIIGINPVSFIAGIGVGTGIGYLLFTGWRGSGSGG